MSYVIAMAFINKKDLIPQALSRIKEKELLDYRKYEILMYGIEEKEKNPVEERDTFKVLVANKETNKEETFYFDMRCDLNLCPEYISNYYLYRFVPNNIKIGDAIRVVKYKSDSDDNSFAYNCIVTNSNVRQFAFIMNASKGPIHRIITARQAYNKGIHIYKYKSPDDLDIEEPNIDDINGEEITCYN